MKGIFYSIHETTEWVEDQNKFLDTIGDALPNHNIHQLLKFHS